MSPTKQSKATRPSVAARAGGIAIIKVGPEGTEYRVHKALLIKHSEYFEKALKGPWKEGEEGVVKLEDVEHGVFEIFVDWLYTHKLPDKSYQWRRSNDEPPKGSARQLGILKAYALSDRIFARAFKKAVRYQVVSQFANWKDIPWYDTIIFAFANLSPNDLVLTLLVNAHCRDYQAIFDINADGELERRAQLPHDFLLRVMVRYGAIADGSTEEELRPCDYHEHESNDEQVTCPEKDVLDYGDSSDSEQSEQEDEDE